jgi:hypothetical protein
MGIWEGVVGMVMEAVMMSTGEDGDACGGGDDAGGKDGDDSGACEVQF